LGGYTNREVGVFSLVRWGVGGTIIVVCCLIAASTLLAIWLRYHAIAALILSVLTYLVVGVVASVKLTEEITPTRHIDEGLIGMTGVVVNEPSSSRVAVVKVGSQLWSARSQTELRRGDLVVVKGREGIYLLVEKAQTTDMPADRQRD